MENLDVSTLKVVGTILFSCAVIHTFMVKRFEHWAKRYPIGSMRENFFHMMGEIEVVFGIWAFLFVGYYTITKGFAIFNADHSQVIGGAIYYLESLDFTEPVFVFVIMTIAGTRPIILLAENLIGFLANRLPLPERLSFFYTTLVVGPLLGSFITEPAAMTVTALTILDYFYSDKMSSRFKYATIGLLFVNISIGGTLSNFAAPPVLMVAGKWHWDILFMITNFGYKAAISIVIGTALVTFIFRKELTGKLMVKQAHQNVLAPAKWVALTHMIFLALVVYGAHHMVFFVAIFLLFLGFYQVSAQYQDKIRLKESLLVGFFLAGLVTLGRVQDWWLQDVLSGLTDIQLFFGAVGLTAITDNAALTYLGSLVELSAGGKYNLVAGAVIGGGLTVIANAPNPAGFGILKKSFGDEGISPLGLFLGALPPTLLAVLFFSFLP